ncbi:MAG: heavy metal translocating P-type ATPase, partial [Haloarculaceae archaeon]
ALVIGPPVSIVSAIGNAARNGVLLKGGEHLERAGEVDLVAFDKTGTLTRGETTVSSVRGFGADEGAVLRLAATAEKRSEHHLADAILAAARDDHGPVADGGLVEREPDRSPVPDPDDFEVVAGKGVVAHHGGREVVVGNRALLADRGVAVPDAVADHARERESAAETAVYVVRDGEVVGVVGLRDELRESAPGVVRALQEAGVRTVMLTGDNERTARAVAEAVGIDDYRAELLPEDKQAAVREFQEAGHAVAMVGDGINDAPSLATADVGVAMGVAGTDTAIETADVALMADDLGRLPYAVSLSKATRRNVSQNIGVAVLTVGLLLAGVLTSTVHLAGGMLVHEGSVLLVIANGMRLLRRRPPTID